MKTILILVCGLVVGGLAVWVWESHQLELVMAAQQTEAQSKAAEMSALQEEVKTLKGIMPTQSHIMADASLQAANLWFAGQKKNWPLATFFFNETRGRIRWTIRINPRPKAAGSEEVVDLQGIFDGIDNGVLTPLKEAIDKKDVTQFTSAYRLMLESCYACHKSTNRPFLRPAIPTAPAHTIINYDPGATWPS